jgi:hypothetical protein
MLGSSTSHNPKGLHDQYRDSFTFTFTTNNTNNIITNNKADHSSHII